MQAEIITIGDEILIGQTVDTNSAWMAKELNQIGISIAQIRSIKDEENSIVNALNLVSSEVQLVLMTGGLGPTKDDITKRVLAEYFHTSLERNQEVLEKIEAYFLERHREILESNRRQADLPIDAEILDNPLGTASGMWFQKDGKVYISMPGVPYEMKGLMSNQVIPRLSQRFELPKIYYRTVMTEGIGESFLAEIISEWEASLVAEGISIAYLPSPGIVKIRLGSEGGNTEEIRKKVDRKVAELYEMVPQYIFGENDTSAEEAIGKLLRQEGKSISTAESCTGGYLAHLFTSVPGSSDYFKGSIISYANEVKFNSLGVNRDQLMREGAVSQVVVEQMAQGARRALNTDFALATSGVAGPDGGSEEKPVGTVWIALASEEGVYAKRFSFEKNRSRNIRRAALAAISMLRRAILGQLEMEKVKN